MDYAYILGVAVSLGVQWLKSYSGLSGWKTMVLLLGLALAAAGVYEALLAAGYWDTVAKVLVASGAFYAFILKRFEGPATA